VRTSNEPRVNCHRNPAHGARRRDRQRMIIGYHTLAHRRTQELDLRALEKGALVFGARQAMPLLTRTSGRSAFSKRFNASSIYPCGATVRGGSGARTTWTTLSSLHLPVMRSSGISREIAPGLP